MAEQALQNFLAAQTLLLQQMQRELTEKTATSNQQMTGIGAALESLQKRISEMPNAVKHMPTDTTGNPMIQNIPWPSPLEVETGDIYENFGLFKQNWLSYCSAAGIDKWPNTDEQRKINILLTIIGDKAKKKYNNFSLTDADKTTVDNVLQVIRKRLVSDRNLLYDRYTFHICNQQEDESFDDYYVRLRKQFEVCRYGEVATTPDDILRDKLAFGIKDLKLKKKFLRDYSSEALTLEKVTQMCRADEISELRVNNMSTHDNEKSVNKLYQESNRKTCRFCDGKHEFKKELCPAWGKNCGFCNGRNHFERACLKKKNKAKKLTVPSKKRVKKLTTDTISEYSSSESESCDDLVIKMLNTNKKVRRKGRTELLIRIKNQWKSVPCDLDTCADVNVIGYENLCNLMESKPSLTKPKIILKGFSGNPVKVVGEIKLSCKKNSKIFHLNFMVVEFNHGILLSEETCLDLELIKYCFKLESIENSNETLKIGRKKAEQILHKYQSVFEGYGCIPGEVSLQIDENVKPVIQPPRRVPISLRKDLKAKLSKLEKEGIIIKEQEPTSWVSNMLLVKKNKSFRICIDPIPLNEALKRPHFQFTTLDEILPEIGNAKIFSTMDAKKGFWQIKLSNDSSKLTTFWTPFGRYRWKRLPFGVSPAPELFEYKIQEIIQDLEGILKLADDFVILGRGDNMEEAIADHNNNLEKLLARLKKFNCKLNKDKVKLCQTSVKFYGHVLTSDGLKPDDEKISAIVNMKKPSDKTELMRFLGMLTYLSRYLPNLSTSSENLRRLTRDNVEWSWGENEENEFNSLKILVTKIETQKYFDVNAPVTLECDASSTGLGVALFQENKIVGFASRTLNRTERNYAQIEKELLSIFFGCTRFDQFLAGNSQITVKTDHKPLLEIFKKPLIKAP